MSRRRRSKIQGRPLLSLTRDREVSWRFDLGSEEEEAGPRNQGAHYAFPAVFPYQANDGKPFITSSGAWNLFFWHNGANGWKEGGK